MRSNTNLSKQSANNLDFDIVDDDDDKTELNQVKPWKLLVVDDDDEVHESTTFALSGVKILNRSLELLHARSASEGFNLLAKHPDCAVALLDVVMESEDAGLKLVEKIRSHGHLELRIILRTGQPGYAPEISVLTEYDINDYRTKSELTRTRLISALTTAIRSYRQLHIINESRRGLSLIVKSSSDIFKRKNFELFAQGVLTQLSGLLGQKNEGLVCIQEKGQSTDESTQKISNLKEDQIIQDIPSANQNNTQKNISKIKGASEDQRFIVVTATQKFAQFVNQDLNQIKDEQVSLVLGKAQRADLGVHINGHLGPLLSHSF